MWKAERRSLESKPRRLGEKNKLVKENTAASIEPINFIETIITAISEIGYFSLSPLIIINNNWMRFL